MKMLKRITYYLKLKAKGAYAVQYWTDGETPYFTYMDRDLHYKRDYLR